jgi:allophanate hydrolase subunit 2
MAGPHSLGSAAWDRLVDGTWTVEGRSNRVGVRLTGPDPVPTAGGRPVLSTGMVTGAVQVPADGNPIVLMPDHATVGGYPVVGCVVSADLAVLGRLGPGQAVRFVPIGLDDALRLAVRHHHALASRVSGWFPTRAGT